MGHISKRLDHSGGFPMKGRLLVFGMLGAMVVLSVALPGGAQTRPDRGFRAWKKYDLKGPAPRLANGHLDLGGVWERPGVDDVTKSAVGPDGMKQEGQADIQFTEAGMKAYKAYDPKNDYAGACLPYGWPRAIQGRHPLQIVQSDDFAAFL